jgi:hypothetical protein
VGLGLVVAVLRIGYGLRTTSWPWWSSARWSPRLATATATVFLFGVDTRGRSLETLHDAAAALVAPAAPVAQRIGE